MTSGLKFEPVHNFDPVQNFGNLPLSARSFLAYRAIVFTPYIWTIKSGTTGAPDITGTVILNRGRLRSTVRVVLNDWATQIFFDNWKEFAARFRKYLPKKIHIEIHGPAFAFDPAAHPHTTKETADIHILDLHKPESFSTNHTRNIKKGKKHNLEVISTSSARALELHADLWSASMDRRLGRNEAILGDLNINFIKKVCDLNLGEFYQCYHGNDIVSSDFIVKIGDNAFYHSAGSTPNGMALGSSHFLMGHVIKTLKEEGFKTLNLGASDPDRPGLSKFKNGFGADSTPMIELNRTNAWWPGARVP